MADFHSLKLTKLIREEASEHDVNVNFRMTLEPSFKAATVTYSGSDPTITVSVTVPIFVNRLLNLYFGQLSPDSIYHYFGAYSPSDPNGDLSNKIAAEIEAYFLACQQGELQLTDVQSLLRLKPAAQDYKSLVFSLVVDFIALHELGHILVERGVLKSEGDSQWAVESSIDAWAVSRLSHMVKTNEHDRTFRTLKAQANREAKTSVFDETLLATDPQETATSLAMLALSIQEHAGTGHAAESMPSRRQYLAARSSVESPLGAGVAEAGLIKFFASAEWRSLLKD